MLQNAGISLQGKECPVKTRHTTNYQDPPPRVSLAKLFALAVTVAVLFGLTAFWTSPAPTAAATSDSTPGIAASTVQTNNSLHDVYTGSDPGGILLAEKVVTFSSSGIDYVVVSQLNLANLANSGTNMAPGTTLGKTNVQESNYPLGNNLSLPNYLGVPNIVLTATLRLTGLPASITVAAYQTSPTGDEKATNRGNSVNDVTNALVPAAGSDGAVLDIRDAVSIPNAHLTVLIDGRILGVLPVVQQGLLNFSQLDAVVIGASNPGLANYLSLPNLAGQNTNNLTNNGCATASPGTTCLLIVAVASKTACAAPENPSGFCIAVYVVNQSNTTADTASSDPVNAQATDTVTVKDYATGQGPAPLVSSNVFSTNDAFAQSPSASNVPIPTSSTFDGRTTTNAGDADTPAINGYYNGSEPAPRPVDTADAPLTPSIKPPATGDAGLAMSSSSSSIWTIVAGVMVVLLISGAAVATVVRR